MRSRSPPSSELQDARKALRAAPDTMKRLSQLSGLGRELGPEGLMAFREPKHIRMRLRSRDVRYTAKADVSNRFSNAFEKRYGLGPETYE